MAAGQPLPIWRSRSLHMPRAGAKPTSPPLSAVITSAETRTRPDRLPTSGAPSPNLVVGLRDGTGQAHAPGAARAVPSLAFLPNMKRRIAQPAAPETTTLAVVREPTATAWHRPATGSAVHGTVLTAGPRSVRAPSGSIRPTPSSWSVPIKTAEEALHGRGRIRASSGPNSGPTAFYAEDYGDQVPSCPAMLFPPRPV